MVWYMCTSRICNIYVYTLIVKQSVHQVCNCLHCVSQTELGILCFVV